MSLTRHRGTMTWGQMRRRLLIFSPAPCCDKSKLDSKHKQLPRPRSRRAAAMGGRSCAMTLDGGAIAGIVIGSIADFVLICWVLRSFFGIGPLNSILGGYDSSLPEQDYYRTHRRHRRPSSSRVASPQPAVVRGRQHGDRSRRTSVYV